MNTTQQLVKDYLDERNWNNLAPANMAKSIMIEGAELLEHFQWINHSVDDINADPALKLNIQKEMADVVIYALELAVHLDIDMSEAVRLKLEHNAAKYPAVEMKNADSSSAYYMAQKMKYRSEGK